MGHPPGFEGGPEITADSSAALRNDKQREQAKTKANAKCGGLSTAQQTVRLSVAPVEMTSVWVE